MAKTVSCNKCGASDLTPISENEYKCLYCSSRIVIEKPKLDLGNFVKTFKPNTIISSSQTTFTPQGDVLKKTSKLGCTIALLAFIGVLAGVIVPLAMFFNSFTNSDETTDKQGWQLSYTPQAFYASGSQGDVIWEFNEENYNWKKNRTTLTIISPATGKKSDKRTIIPEHESSEQVKSVWDLFTGGRVYGDLIYFTPKNGGLVAYNIYTGVVAFDNAHFEKVVGDQIAGAYAYTNSNTNNQSYIEIKSAQGIDYYYYPEGDSAVTRESVTQAKNRPKADKYYFALAGNGEKKYVLRVKQEMDAYERTGFFRPSTLKEFQQQKKYYSGYHKVYSVDSVAAKNGFFDGEFITWNDTSFILKFKGSLLENAPVVIAAYGLSGKQLWSVVPNTSKPFSTLEKKDDNPRFDIMLVNDKSIVVSLTSPKKSAMGIDTKTGKITWTYESVK